jgi:hypothetical protein
MRVMNGTAPLFVLFDDLEQLQAAVIGSLDWTCVWHVTNMSLILRIVAVHSWQLKLPN